MASSYLLLVLVPTLLFSVAFSGGFKESGWEDLLEDYYWNDYYWQKLWYWEGYCEWWNLYEQNGIIDKISEGIVPYNKLHIEFRGSNVEPGANLSLTTTLMPPTYIGWNNCDDDETYSLIFVDLDAVGSNTGDTYVQWRVSDIRDCEVPTRVQEIYRAPKPLEGSGPHLYYIGVWKQTHFFNLLEQTRATAGRLYFPLRDYIEKVGRPWAGTFMRVYPILGDLTVLPETDQMKLGGATGPVSNIGTVY